MVLNEECKDCLYNSQMKKVISSRHDADKLAQFKREVRSLCDNPPDNYCAPLLMRDIDSAHRRIFGCGIDYSSEKKLFNGMLLELEDELYSKVITSSDPLKTALKFAMASNYIDFARLADLDGGAVQKVISAAEKAEPDACALGALKERLSVAKTLCYLHDNCGEAVLDKILIRVILKFYNGIGVTSVVRGGAILNDTTVEDAYYIGLDRYARIVGNGTNVPGTPLSEISAEVKDILKNSDVIISKGLGNLETLYGRGLGEFSCFCCKCRHIAERFSVPLWSSVFIEGQ